VRSGACFAVELSDHFVGLDIDKSEAAQWVTDFLISELRRRQIAPVVQNSGTPGHLHLFARVADAGLKREIEAAARLFGCVVRVGQRIRPPLSPHRLGLHVSLITPPRVIEAVQALTPADEQKELAGKKMRGASGRMFSLLRDGDCDGRYQSRSEVVQALATMAVNQGYSQEWLLKVLLNPSNRAGEKIQRMGETEARRYVAQSYLKARAFVANHPAFGDRGGAAAAIVEEIDRATDIVLRSAGPGQAGATDYSVLAAHLAVARRVGSLTYGASDREIAELAGLSRPTVTLSHRRLTEKGEFLKRIKRPAIGAATASQWRIRLPAGSVLGDTSPTLMGGVRPTGKADHTPALICGAEERGSASQSTASGRSSRRRRPRPSSQPLWASKCAASGITSGCLRTSVFATRDVDGKWHRCDVDLDAVANRLGVAGEGARQRARHAREREINTQRLRRRAEALSGAYGSFTESDDESRERNSK
jgi:hypothetical protein